MYNHDSDILTLYLPVLDKKFRTINPFDRLPRLKTRTTNVNLDAFHERNDTKREDRNEEQYSSTKSFCMIGFRRLFHSEYCRSGVGLMDALSVCPYSLEQTDMP